MIEVTLKDPIERGLKVYFQRFSFTSFHRRYTQRPDRKGTERFWDGLPQTGGGYSYTQRPDRKGTERSGTAAPVCPVFCSYTQRPDRKGTESATQPQYPAVHLLHVTLKDPIERGLKEK